MSETFFKSYQLPYLDQIDNINSDFIVISSKNDIPNFLQPQTNYLSLKILDFSSHLKLLQKQKSLDQISSENHLKTIEELKLQENSNIISNYSLYNSSHLKTIEELKLQENSNNISNYSLDNLNLLINNLNIFTLGRPFEEQNNEYNEQNNEYNASEIDNDLNLNKKILN